MKKSGAQTKVKICMIINATKRISPITGIAIVLITSLLMDFIHDEVSSRLIRMLVAGVIAGGLTLLVLTRRTNQSGKDASSSGSKNIPGH